MILSIIATILIFLIVVNFIAGVLPLYNIAILLLIGIGIGVSLHSKSLEKELITAYKTGNENAYLKS